MLGVAIPVELTDTTVSTSEAAMPAAASALRAASMNNALPPSTKAVVRSGQPSGWAYHSSGRTAWRVTIPLLVPNTRDNRPKSS